MNGNHSAPVSRETHGSIKEPNLAKSKMEDSANPENNSGEVIYENLSIPVSQLPIYIQKMKERGDGFQKEFQVSHCYVCL